MSTAINPSVDRALQAPGQNIALALRRRDMLQANLASRVGASVSTVRRLEDEHFGAFMAQLMGQAFQFELTVGQALTVMRQVVKTMGKLRTAGESTCPRIDAQYLVCKLH